MHTCGRAPACPCCYCVDAVDPERAQATSKVLRAPRNPQHPLRVPGGPILANTSSQVVAASSLKLPTRRIPTVVTGAGKARRVRGATTIARAGPAPAVTSHNASALGATTAPVYASDRKAANAGRAFLLDATNATSAQGAPQSSINTTTEPSSHTNLQYPL